MINNNTTFLLTAIFILVLVSLPVGAGTLTGSVKDTKGKLMQGVMVRMTDEARGVSESVYTNASGHYLLTTSLEGELSLRLRTPYYRDAKAKVKLSADSRIRQDMLMVAMTNDVEISDSLPAAYHFGNLPFETGEHANFNRFQFQRDCLSCHQLGNPFTRVPRSAKSWSETIQRMHLYLGNFDMKLRDSRSVIFEKGFDGKPLSVRPVFPLDESLSHTKIYEYPLKNMGVPHDAIVHPHNKLIYTVDQAQDYMSITDTATGRTEYVLQTGGDAMKFHQGNPNKGVQLGLFNPTDKHGPHSLDLGIDGKYYVTNTGSTSIGVFNPQTKEWEASHKIPRDTKAIYPHTIRVAAKGMVWFTLAGSEQVGRLDPKTGKFDILNLPKVIPGGISGTTQPYGIDISPLDNSTWYGRLFGDKIGRIDADTLEITEYDSPIRGPRRMRFDKKGILWVTGYSEGNLARIDTDGFISKVYTMPEFAEGYRPAPYALGIHPETQDIWINENMTDRIYRFIPAEERFVVYPVPLSGTYTRDMTFADNGQICTSNNPIPAPSLEGGLLEIICIDINYKAEGTAKLDFN